jgi:hypothetical protein
VPAAETGSGVGVAETPGMLQANMVETIAKMDSAIAAFRRVGFSVILPPYGTSKSNYSRFKLVIKPFQETADPRKFSQLRSLLQI